MKRRELAIHHLHQGKEPQDYQFGITNSTQTVSLFMFVFHRVLLIMDFQKLSHQLNENGER